MRLLLTLLALLTGFASADRAMAAPAVPAAMGSLVMLAESAGKVEASDSERRPTATTPTRRTSSGGGGGGVQGDAGHGMTPVGVAPIAPAQDRA